MRSLLLYPDGDVVPTSPEHDGDLAGDLGLGVLVTAMAHGDQYLQDVLGGVMRASLTTPEQIRYRQDILADCLRRPSAVRALHDLASAAIDAERQIWGGIQPSAGFSLQRSLQVMDLFLRSLRQLRKLADDHAAHVTSAGLSRLLGTLRAELDNAYLGEVAEHLSGLRFRHGVQTGASLGLTGKGANYVLRRPARGGAGMLGWLSSGGRNAGYELVISDRDVTGQQALTSLRDRATAPVANVLAQSCDNVRAFFDVLRFETGFYIGCLNLHEQLLNRGEPLCMPNPVPAGVHALTAAGLRDAALLLTSTAPVIGNGITADGKSLIFITGANQGGKSTFLRSLGIAQLMMQAGLFVAADSFTSTVCQGLHTHFRRPEDATMTRGKLDEELRRMSAIVDAITPGSMLLCNESFSATNEREGSQLARNVIRAMLDCGVRVFFVTHFYDLASGFYADMRHDALYLRADRQPDGSRTFRLTEGPPLLTSHATDIYDQVFGKAASRGSLPRCEAGFMLRS